MSILKTSDFDSGRYFLAVNAGQKKALDIYIDYAEKYYLKRMMGLELYELFIADLDLPVVGEPTSPRFVKIYNSLDVQNGGVFYSSEGIKEMLKGLTYFYYLRDLNAKVATTGTITTNSSNSTNISPYWAGITSRYNQGIDSYRAIQEFINGNEDYPEYKGVEVCKSHQF